MKVRFLPKGGFNNNGAFVEYEGDAPTQNMKEYQRQSYLRLDIIATKFNVGTKMGVNCEFEEVKVRKCIKTVSATGKIDPARWGNYTLSFLGKNITTSEISIAINENSDGEAVAMAGININGDLDLEDQNEFFIELEIYPDRFELLLNELSIPGAVLHISAHVDRFRDFYAEWSPSISDGRVIKFLNNKRDVENADEIPEDFWRTNEFQKELVSDPEDPPVTIIVRRPLQAPLAAPSSEENDKDDWDTDDEAKSEGCD
ncbi:hypothetical protein [Fodinicurvata sp. EGI_FJ10296]|uniref:hypothetical protein n=1 Tax=Fodinicurvata sp. EGI_FJ10296 TaxID=3231908 RepID=UPI0034568803